MRCRSRPLPLIKLVKMMHRAVAVADGETVGGGDRGADPGLGVAHGGFHVVALGEAAAMAEDSEQPVPWVFLVATRGADSVMVPFAVTK